MTFTEKREPFVIDQAKFSTQRQVTWALLAIFACVVAVVMSQNDQSERSMVLQTVINLTLLAVGYWLGASKAAADSNQSLSRMAEAAPTVAAAVVAAAAPKNENPIKADDVNIEASGAVNVAQPPKGSP